MRSTYSYLISTVLLWFVTGCVPLGTTPTSTVSKPMIFKDYNYEDYVGNVILNSTNPFVNLNGAEIIHLEFDLLATEFENLQAYLVHCNFDWTRSVLPDLEFLQAFNRFDHVRFDYSINTKRKYIQYFFELAKPKLSGNYLVVLHRRNNPDDILFTRRMVVFDDKVQVQATMKLPTVVSQRPTHQQIDFSLSYSGLEAPSPVENIKTVIMQNKNWESAIVNLSPTYMEPSSKRMEWDYFSGETSFPGWNQFRWLDLRTLNVRGMGVSVIDVKESGISVIQGTDSDIGANSYRQLINDNNGRMIPGNSDPGEIYLEADYASVLFTLKSERIAGKIHITGRFNDWRKDFQNEMRYDEDRKIYYSTQRLKQGFYDYRYEVQSPSVPVYKYEGSFFMSENEYDILVYYRGPGRLNDEVVAIKSINSVNFF